MNDPLVYVILVNYNGWRDTIECLESVLRSDYPNTRVIVCDNASTDGSVHRIQAWARGGVVPEAAAPFRYLSAPPLAKPVAVTLLHETDVAIATAGTGVTLIACDSNRGFAAANNVALRWIERSGDAHALLLNNDTVIAPDAVGRMMQTTLTTRRAGAVGATVLRYYEPDRVETLGGARVSLAHGMVKTIAGGSARSALRPPRIDIDYVSATCILVTPDVLRRVGFLDERYFLYGEDCDWGLRMRAAGFVLTYDAGAEVWHKGGASVGHGAPAHDYYDVRARLLLIHKHHPMMLPLTLGHTEVRCLLPKLLRGEWARGWAVIRAQRDFLAITRSRGVVTDA